MKYTIIIPVFKRLEIIHFCLNSIRSQTLKPQKVIFVNNNEIKSKDSINLKSIIKKFNKESGVSTKLINSPKNSGAIARNLGAYEAETEYVAFLDSDVVLEDEYYEKIGNYFKENKELIAVQGLDKSLIEYQKTLKNVGLLMRIFIAFEQFFEISFLINKKSAFVSPSLAVAHPNVLEDFEIFSEWISTCAGVFKKKLFDHYSFCSEFITYSNNEYLYFSHQLFKNKRGLMLYTSKPKYRDIQTKLGRLNKVALLYQIQTYDFFIFLNLFKLDIFNLCIFIKSRIGHVFINILKLIIKKEICLINYFHVIYAVFYPLVHLKFIRKGDLSFYEKDFPC